MPNSVLPSHATVASTSGIGAAPREPNVPWAWPGSYVPNFSDWRPGDIVLVEGIGLSGLFIQAGQAMSARAMALASGWSHAAIYAGGDIVVDATIADGIQRRSIWSYVHQRAITVRRLDDPSMPANAGIDIVLAASSHIGKGYSRIQIALGKLGWLHSLAPSPDALYCSSLVGLCVAQALGVVLWSNPAFQPLFPGALAVHPDLQPIQLHWRNT